MSTEDNKEYFAKTKEIKCGPQSTSNFANLQARYISQCQQGLEILSEDSEKFSQELEVFEKEIITKVLFYQMKFCVASDGF